MEETKQINQVENSNNKDLNSNANSDIRNLDSLSIESRKVKMVKLYSDNDYGDVNADEIELNNMMPNQANLNFLYADICIILTVSSLFSCLLPLAPIALLLFSSFSLNLHIHNSVKVFKRSGGANDSATSIGLWQDILEVMSTLSIVFNFFLYYYFSPNQFNEFELIINKTNISDVVEIEIGKGEASLFWFVVMEHILLVLKYFLRFALPDVPHWVSKEKEYLLMLNDSFNRKKEEAMNSEMKNYVRKSFLKIKDFVEKETKKGKELSEKFKANEELLKKYRKELLAKSVELADAQCIIENLEENLVHVREVDRMEKEFESEKNRNLNRNSFCVRINSDNNDGGGESKRNGVVYSTDLKSVANKLKQENNKMKKKNNEIDTNANSNGKNSNSIKDYDKNDNKNGILNSPMSSKSFNSFRSKTHYKIIETKLEFKFDKIFKNMIQQILFNRNIILEDDKETMKTLIYKVYVINIFKNTFEKIEREIFNKKLTKMLNNINQPIILCNSCFEKVAIIYCWECQEKLCYECKKTHNSNSLWVNHHLQKFILPEYRENVIDKNNELDRKSILLNSININNNLETNNNNYKTDEIDLIANNQRLSSNDSNASSYDYYNFNYANNQRQKSNKVHKTRRSSVGVFDANCSILNNNQNNNLYVESIINRNNNINNNYNNSEANFNIAFAFKNIFNKIKGKTGITKNILLKENESTKNNFGKFSRKATSPEKGSLKPFAQDRGVLFKLEGFYFPTTTQSYNYQNLNYYFQILYKEYISKNGINEKNNIETKFIIENQINFYVNLKQNPMSILGKEFSHLILKSNFNFEEQFFINRICFMRFKQCGANLTFHDIFAYLKILQNGTYEEKLRLIILILDINDAKLILRTEFEKLLGCVCLQNHSPDFRLKSVLELFFGKSSYFVKAENFFHLCLDNLGCKDVMCEILQVYLDE